MIQGYDRYDPGGEAKIRLFLLTALAMLAFAANSLLNRMALAQGAIGPSAFAAISVTSGVFVLFVLLGLRERSWPRAAAPNLIAVAALATYMLGFSFAYVSMDAGLGALMLFAGVQITMFVGAVVEGERPPTRRWTGMALALAGMLLLNWPSGKVLLDVGALALMVCAAVGWGVYSLIGRRVADPLGATGSNFVYCVPLVLMAFFVFPDVTSMRPDGVFLAMISGGVTSALGYALWYALLPNLGATLGALAQLSVPAIALGLGAVILGETITWPAVLAAMMILGGIAVGLVPLAKAAR